MVGFVLFTAWTILPLFGLIMPMRTLGLLYAMGFLPSAATAVVFYWVRRGRAVWVTVLATAISAPVFAVFWLAWLLPAGIYPISYMSVCLLCSASLATLVMTLRPSRLAVTCRS